MEILLHINHNINVYLTLNDPGCFKHLCYMTGQCIYYTRVLLHFCLLYYFRLLWIFVVFGVWQITNSNWTSRWYSCILIKVFNSWLYYAIKNCIHTETIITSISSLKAHRIDQYMTHIKVLKYIFFFVFRFEFEHGFKFKLLT